jgi:hypothetical protein
MGQKKLPPTLPPRPVKREERFDEAVCRRRGNNREDATGVTL